MRERAQTEVLADTRPVSLIQTTHTGGRWAVASFIAQLALLALGLVAGLTIGRRMEVTQAGLDQQRQQSEVEREKIKALTDQTSNT